MTAFASSKNALGICDVCGFQYKLRELRSLTVRGRVVNTLACPECWNEDHPQNELGKYPVRDPQALQDPRPDFAEIKRSRTIQWGWNPVGYSGDIYGLSPNDLVAKSAVGTVTIETT